MSNPTIKMTDIPNVWPPEPGPHQRTTGLKTIPGQIRGRHTETLVGLHDTAWWTGVQLLCPDAPEMEFYVTLRSEVVALPFTKTTAWFQKARDWQVLPWAIPAAMATTLRLYLDIYPIGLPSGTPLWVSRRLGFHELGANLSAVGRYVFAGIDGEICATWDERFSAWAKKDHGHVPVWGDDYTVVPALHDFLFHHYAWVEGERHKLLDWDEFIPMPRVSMR